MRNDLKLVTLMSVHIVETVTCGGVVLDVFEGFFCHKLEYTPSTDFVTDMFEKSDFFEPKRKDSLQNLAKKSVYPSMVVLLEKIKTMNTNVLLRLG